MTVTSAPAATRFGFVFALWAAGLGAAAQYAKISVIFDPLGAHYGQEGAALGLLVSAVGVVGIILGVVAGIIVTRLTLRRAMLIGLVLGGVLSLYQATLPALPLFIASRVVEGASHLLIVVAAPTLIAQASSLRGRGFTLTLWGSFFGVSFTLLILLGLPLVAAFGLPALFVAHGLYMLAFAAGLWRAIPQDAPAKTELSLQGVLAQHAAIYRSPRKNAAGLGWLFYTFCFVTTVTFVPGFIDDDIRRTVAAAMPLVSIVASLTLGVALLSVMSAVSVTMLAFATGAALAISLLLAPGNALLVLCFMAALGIIQGSSFAVVPELNETLEDRAQGNGAMAQTGNIGNSLGTPVIAALLAGAGYEAMMAALALSLALGFGIHLWMAKLRR
ncbi:MAG: MFS transporter [Pseudomonadota bacterium]